MALLHPLRQPWLRVPVIIFIIFLLATWLWIYNGLLHETLLRLSSIKGHGSNPSSKAIAVDLDKSPIPQKIWQIIFKDDNCDPEDLREVKSWLANGMYYQ